MGPMNIVVSTCEEYGPTKRVRINTAFSVACAAVSSSSSFTSFCSAPIVAIDELPKRPRVASLTAARVDGGVEIQRRTFIVS